MRKGAAKADRKLVKVQARLFVADVDRLKATAEEQGVPWGVTLRALVHRGVKSMHAGGVL